MPFVVLWSFILLLLLFFLLKIKKLVAGLSYFTYKNQIVAELLGEADLIRKIKKSEPETMLGGAAKKCAITLQKIAY